VIREVLHLSLLREKCSIVSIVKSIEFSVKKSAGSRPIELHSTIEAEEGDPGSSSSLSPERKMLNYCDFCGGSVKGSLIPDGLGNDICESCSEAREKM